MNESGSSVASVLSYYKLLPLEGSPLSSSPLIPARLNSRSGGKGVGGIKGGWGDYLTVIHDDIDIKLGQYKISVDSRSAGHRGVQSIIDQLKTKNFKRIRIGIRTPALEKIPADLARRNEAEAAKFVLQKFNEEEEKKVLDLVAEIIKQIK